MVQKITTLICGLFLSVSVFAQYTSSNFKECRVSGGFGISSGIKNASANTSAFLQLDYSFSPNFSLATDFAYLPYTRPGYITDLPIQPNIQRIWDNNFSLLIKYHLPINSKFKTSVATGWTFIVKQSEYYTYTKDINGTTIFRDRSTSSDFGIPFFVDTNYPLWKNLSAVFRISYYANANMGSTYAIGAGILLKI